MADEIKRVQISNLKELATNEPLVVYDLFKQFKGKEKFKVAVDHLSFGVSKNECFGYI